MLFENNNNNKITNIKDKRGNTVIEPTGIKKIRHYYEQI